MITRQHRVAAKKQFRVWKNKLKALIDRECKYELETDGTLTLLMPTQITKTVWSITMRQLQKTIKTGNKNDLIEAMNKFARVAFSLPEEDTPTAYGAFVPVGDLRRALFLLEEMQESGKFDHYEKITTQAHASIHKALIEIHLETETQGGTDADH